MGKAGIRKKWMALLLGVSLLASSSGIAHAQSAAQPVRTLTMDTRSYQMAPGNIYDFRAAVSGPGLQQEQVEVYSSRDGIAKVSRIAGTNKYRITGAREGVTYVMARINGVHASIKVTVQKGVKQQGEACRSVSIVGYNTPASQSEMRAVWIPYMSLDMSASADKSEAAFQKKFDAMVSQAKSSGMNALIVHVRPFGDSLYPSQYFPWSHLLTGTQGQNPGYDPLAYMVKATHAAGLQFHAWVNPLRVRLRSLPTALSSDHPSVQWSADPQKQNWTMHWEGESYFNPGVAQVRDRLVAGVAEIVKNYDVDGVQFDDYFYPTQSASLDSTSYTASGTTLSLADWRKQNINTLVSQVYSSIKAIKPGVVFGISPQANFQNNSNMSADVTTWATQSGYVDYLCPQLYVNFDHAVMPYNTTALQWRTLVKNSNVKLYFGLALYKAGSDADGGSWKGSGTTISRQIQSGRDMGMDGFMLYSMPYLNNEQTREEMKNVQALLN